ncbi:hypothetical protein RUND412_005009 [Rhizina undulata]
MEPERDLKAEESGYDADTEISTRRRRAGAPEVMSSDASNCNMSGSVSPLLCQGPLSGGLGRTLEVRVPRSINYIDLTPETYETDGEQFDGGWDEHDVNWPPLPSRFLVTVAAANSPADLPDNGNASDGSQSEASIELCSPSGRRLDMMSVDGEADGIYFHIHDIEIEIEPGVMGNSTADEAAANSTSHPSRSARLAARAAAVDIEMTDGMRHMPVFTGDHSYDGSEYNFELFLVPVSEKSDEENGRQPAQIPHEDVCGVCVERRIAVRFPRCGHGACRTCTKRMLEGWGRPDNIFPSSFPCHICRADVTARGLDLGVNTIDGQEVGDMQGEEEMWEEEETDEEMEDEA